MILNRNRRFFSITLMILICSSLLQAQPNKWKEKIKKDRSKMYECGYVYEPSLLDKANPTKLLVNSLDSGGGKSDLGKIAISVFYQSHLHPQEIVKYPTETPGWETCGEALFVGMTNRSGIGVATTDGKVLFEGKEIPHSGFGTYFQGYPADTRTARQVQITSSNGDKVDLEIQPVLPIEIKSIDGKSKSEKLVLDGSKDIVVELIDGAADPKSKIHISLVSSLMTAKNIYDLMVSPAKDRIVIPKEAFFNYEGSPAPFVDANTIIVSRVREEVLKGTTAGALRTVCSYEDWMPVQMEGEIAKGALAFAGFDTTKNTQLNIDLSTTGHYNFKLKKSAPYQSPPISQIKKVAVASFVVRGNLSDQAHGTDGVWEVITTKWFPELQKSTWQNLADQMYQQFENQLSSEFGMEFLPLEQVVSAEAYSHTKAIADNVSQNYVEVGAGGTKRILTTAFDDVIKDLSISFPSDFVSERLIQELGVDAVVAITIDLDFAFESEGLDPSVNMVFFAPNVSYKTAATYFKAQASTQALSLNEAKKHPLPVSNVLYEMIHWDTYLEEMTQAVRQLKGEEAAEPAYGKIWAQK